MKKENTTKAITLKRKKPPDKSVKTKRVQLIKLIRLCIAVAGLAVLLGVLALIKLSTAVSEFMVTKVSRNIIMVMGRVSSALPFSMYELLLYLAGIAIIGGIIAIIALLIRKKYVNSLRVLASLVLAALIVGNVYFISAGFSYNRYKEYFPTYNPELTKEQAVQITEYFIDDFNDIAESLKRDENGYAIMPYSTPQLSDKLRQEYFRLSGYDINPYTPKAKVIFSSGIMSEMHICGVFFAPFGEPNVNGLMPKYELPFTMAHELAHAKGVMREGDANDVALYITLTSSDPFIRYSGYAERIGTLLEAVWTWDMLQRVAYEESDYARLVRKISPLIRQDWSSSGEFWSKYTLLIDISNKINDFYLQIMGQKEGTAAYAPPATDVVEKPVTDPDTGKPIVDPDSGKPITEQKPEFNTVQQIFLQAYLERAAESFQE